MVAAACVLATAMAFAHRASITTDRRRQPRPSSARRAEQIRRLEGFFKMYHRIMGRFPLEAEGFTPLQARC